MLLNLFFFIDLKFEALESKVQIRLRIVQMRKFYEKKIKQKVFYVLRRNQLEYKNFKSNWLRAEEFEMRYLKMRVYSKWSEKLDEKSEIQKLHLYCKARQHHERRLTRECLKKWVLFKGSQQILNVSLYYFISFLFKSFKN
jgi:hypothetical protein